MHKRKVFIDAFAEGLEVFKIRSAINLYPEMFKALFVASDTCTPDNVIATLSMPCTMSPEDQRIAGYLKDCIKQLDESGIIYLECTYYRRVEILAFQICFVFRVLILAIRTKFTTFADIITIIINTNII